MPANRTVVLSEAAYRQIQTYAISAGIPIDHAASDAISEWMKSTGDFVIEASKKMRMTTAAKPKLTLVSSAGSRINHGSDSK